MEHPTLYERILSLAKARLESVEETALALSISAGSIRAYKAYPKREPRPKVLRRLEELEAQVLEGLLAGPSSRVPPFRNAFDRGAYTARHAGESSQSGHTPMQRIEVIQRMAEENAENIEQIKEMLGRLLEVASQLVPEKDKKRRA